MLSVLSFHPSDEFHRSFFCLFIHSFRGCSHCDCRSLIKTVSLLLLLCACYFFRRSFSPFVELNYVRPSTRIRPESFFFSLRFFFFQLVDDKPLTMKAEAFVIKYGGSSSNPIISISISISIQYQCQVGIHQCCPYKNCTETFGDHSSPLATHGVFLVHVATCQLRDVNNFECDCKKYTSADPYWAVNKKKRLTTHIRTTCLNTKSFLAETSTTTKHQRTGLIHCNEAASTNPSSMQTT